MMTHEQHMLAERTVPRYTSYPTAPHFSDRVNAAVYADWLSQLSTDSALSLYLHVPFCRELCLYCGCHTKAIRRREPVDAYASLLVQEIETVARHLVGRRVSHIHWGGGTPSALGTDNLLRVKSAIDLFFDTSAVREHAIELDPRHVDPELVDALARIGINRASLGVQDFSPHVQRAIGRIQPYEQVARTVEGLRLAGIRDLNFDLMYGLPAQSVDDVLRTAARACGLQPQRIALFGYAHVPWLKKQQRLLEAWHLPEAAERLAQMQAGWQVFLNAGYEPIGFDHFALPSDSLAQAARSGKLRRNFQGYTSDDADALLGFGASAIGRLPFGYAQNAADAGSYGRAVSAGALPTARGIQLSAADKVRAQIIERLLCDLRVDLDTIGPNEFEREFATLAPLCDQGYVEIGSDSLAVTECGRPFARLVAAAFDTYRRDGDAGGSRAV